MVSLNKLKSVRPAVLLLGFISLITQILVLREFLTFFNGNEPVIGVILANWMLLTGTGAYLGKFISRHKKREKLIYPLLGLMGFMPLITILLLHILWHVFFLPGIMTGLVHVFYYSLLILFPFCLLSGILFIVLAKEESFIAGKNKIGNVYAWESIGSLIGGVIINFVLIWLLSTFQSLYVVMVIMVIATVILTIKTEQYFTSGILLFVAMLFSFLFFGNSLDIKIRGMALPGQNVVYSSDTPFGVFVITEQEEQTNYYENNVLIAYSGDIVSKEESVHLAMIQHEKPQHVLVFSGIISGIIDEIKEYPVNSIDYVDINPEIIKIAKQSIMQNQLEDIRLIEMDPLRFLRNNQKKYDLVLINLPKPTTIQLNRYYTYEFFKLLKANLNKNAVISLSVSASANYLNEETNRLLSIIYNTIKSQFENVVILPVNQDYIIASDGGLSYQIAKKIEEKNIPTEYVNTYYFDDELTYIKSQKLMTKLNENVPLNKNFNPVFYQSQIKLWLSHFNIKYWVPAILILVFSGFFFVKAGYIYKGVFITGLASTSIEIVLMLVFQIVFGYVYTVAGIFIMVFMGGLALGAYYISQNTRVVNKKTFVILLFLLSVLSFTLPFLFSLIQKINLNDIILFVIFFVLTLLTSFFTGSIFTVACKISKYDLSTVASDTYGYDLLGAATGALLFTIYVIPALGLSWSVFIIGVIILLLALLNLLKKA